MDINWWMVSTAVLWVLGAFATLMYVQSEGMWKHDAGHWFALSIWWAVMMCALCMIPFIRIRWKRG